MGKSAAQLSSGTVTLAEYFPQLPYLIQSAAADHDDFQSLVTLSPDDELPVLDEVGNRSMIMCPGSDTYSRQLSMGGHASVFRESEQTGRVEGFTVHARVQITRFPSSMIKQRRGGLRGRLPTSTSTSTSPCLREEMPPVARVCILRWGLLQDADHGIEIGNALPPFAEQASSEQSPQGPEHENDDRSMVASTVDRSRRYSTTQRFLEGLLESEEENIPRVFHRSRDVPSSEAIEAESPVNDQQHNPKQVPTNSFHQTGLRHQGDITIEIPGYYDNSKRAALTTNILTEGSVRTYRVSGVESILATYKQSKVPTTHSALPKGLHWAPDVEPRKSVRSVDTGGTGSTASSGLSVLRSHLDGTQRRAMEPALKTLKRTVIGVLALACILAITFATLNAIVLESFQFAMYKVELSGDRLYYGADIAIHVQKLNMMWTGDITAADEEFAAAQADLEKVAFELEERHQKLFLEANEDEVMSR